MPDRSDPEREAITKKRKACPRRKSPRKPPPHVRQRYEDDRRQAEPNASRGSQAGREFPACRRRAISIPMPLRTHVRPPHSCVGSRAQTCDMATRAAPSSATNARVDAGLGRPSNLSLCPSLLASDLSIGGRGRTTLACIADPKVCGHAPIRPQDAARLRPPVRGTSPAPPARARLSALPTDAR